MPSAAKLATGLFYEKVFGVVLWSYASYKFNLFGYICLRISLTWGVLITIAMGVIFPLVRKLIEKNAFRADNYNFINAVGRRFNRPCRVVRSGIDCGGRLIDINARAFHFIIPDYFCLKTHSEKLLSECVFLYFSICFRNFA